MGRAEAGFRAFFSKAGDTSTCIVGQCGKKFATRSTASLEAHHLATHVVPALENELRHLRSRLATHGEDIPKQDIADLLTTRPVSKPTASSSQPTLRQALDGREERSASQATRARERDVIITELVINNNLSYNVCESPEFVSLMKHADAKYKPPSRKRLAGPLLNGLYAGAMRYLDTELPQFKYFGTTTDMWTSTPLDSYMAFIATGVDEGFNLRTFMAGCEPVHGKHTGANLAAAFHEAGKGIKIRDRIGAVTADHARNNLVMGQILEDCDIVGCICHMLHLTVMDVLQPKKLKKTGYKAVPGADNKTVAPEPDTTTDPIEHETEQEAEPEKEDDLVHVSNESRRSKRARTLSHKMQTWSGAPVSLVQTAAEDEADENEDEDEDEDPFPPPDTLPQLSEADQLVPLNIIARTTALTVLFTTSSTNKAILKAKIRADKFDDCMPKRYGMTRWDSFYFMLKTLVVHREAVEAAVDELAHAFPPNSKDRKKMEAKLLTADEWAEAKILCDVLEPFTVLNKKLQSSAITIHLVYRGLFNTLSQLLASDDVDEADFPGVSDLAATVRFREQIKARLFGVLTHRIKTMSKFEWAAFEAGAAFDPALATLEVDMSKLADGDLSRPPRRSPEEQADRLLANLATLHVTSKIEVSDAVDTDADVVAEPPAKRTKTTDYSDALGAFLVDDEMPDAPSSQEGRHESRLRTALCAYFSVVSKIDKEHPLRPLMVGTFESGGIEKFWRAAVKSELYFSGLVADAARAVFAILAASAASERVFSAAGLIVSDRRCNINPEKVNMMAVVKAVSSRAEGQSSGRFRPYYTQRAGGMPIKVKP